MSILYNRIAELCERHGITAYRLCKETGIRASTITDLKMGRKKGLSAEVAEKIARYFGVSVSYLLGADSETEKDQPAVNADDELAEYLQAAHDNPKLRVLFKRGRNATPEKLDAILALLGSDEDEYRKTDSAAAIIGSAEGRID